MVIDPKIILIWAGAHADIPAGYERVTALDGKYPKSEILANINLTGGSNTHTHTSPLHTHTLVSHNHTGYLNTCAVNYVSPGGDNGGGGSLREHNHNVTSSSTAGGSLIGAAVTWASASNEPPFYEVIFIKPTTPAPAPDEGILLFNGNAAPLNWLPCDGANSTPDLRGKYLKGAGTGQNAGTTGGATLHAHSVTHLHTANSHTHSGTSDGPINSTRTQASGGSTAVAYAGHAHTVDFAATVATVNNYTDITAGNGDSVEVLHKSIGAIKNNGGILYKGMVALTLSTDIPIGWALCDGQNGTLDLTAAFIKIPSLLSDKTDTPVGANTHTHTPVSHTHIGAGHSHSATTGSANSGVNSPDIYSGGNYALTSHGHSVSSISSVVETYSTDTLSSDSASNEPEYLTVAYIQLVKIDDNGGCMISCL